MRHIEVLEYIPGLDSICRHEGEHTFVKLVDALRDNSHWENIQGLSYRKNGLIYTNASRPLEADLDVLPFPVRLPEKFDILGRKVATILAGRGCNYNCSFCSIRQFYSDAPGRLKRIRKPEAVAEEMELLYNKTNTTIFLFQDDDFPIAGRFGHRWSREFCRLLAESGLSGNILWKISCRPDEVDSSLFSVMKDHGLSLVYLGIESGNETGLRVLNKRLTPEKSLHAIEVLRNLDIMYEYGFMLFDPSSSFESVRTNLHFLERITAKGTAPVGFCKMLPYAGTPIQEQLEKENRLAGKLGAENYNFLDKKMDSYFNCISDCFSPWMATNWGVQASLRQTRIFLMTLAKLLPNDRTVNVIKNRLDKVTESSNRFLLRTAEDMISYFENGKKVESERKLSAVSRTIERKHARFVETIQSILVDVCDCVALPDSRPSLMSRDVQ